MADNVYKPYAFERSQTEIGTSFTDIGDNPEIFLNVGGSGGPCSDLVFEMANTGSLAAADFQMLVKDHPSGAWQTLITGATWGTVAGILKSFLGALNTLAVDAVGDAFVNIGPRHAIKFQAKCASPGSSVVTNGDMSASTGWTLTNCSIAAGKLTVTAPGDYSLSRSVTLHAGTYTITADVVTSTGSNTIGAGVTGADGDIPSLAEQATSVATFTGEIFTIVTAGTYTIEVFGVMGTALEIDNVTCKPSRAAITVRGMIR